MGEYECVYDLKKKNCEELTQNVSLSPLCPYGSSQQSLYKTQRTVGKEKKTRQTITEVTQGVCRDTRVKNSSCFKDFYL